jgi:hypothetical protein
MTTMDGVTVTEGRARVRNVTVRSSRHCHAGGPKADPARSLVRMSVLRRAS